MKQQLYARRRECFQEKVMGYWVLEGIAPKVIARGIGVIGLDKFF